MPKKPVPLNFDGETVRIKPVLRHKADIPAEIAQFKSTLRKLASGAYQRRILNHYALEAITTALQSLIQQSAEGSVQASQKILEVYHILKGAGDFNIYNLSDNRSVNVGGGGGEGGERGHANFIRMLAEAREKRRLEGSPANGLAHTTLDATFVETPEGPRED